MVFKKRIEVAKHALDGVVDTVCKSLNYGLLKRHMNYAGKQNEIDSIVKYGRGLIR